MLILNIVLLQTTSLRLIIIDNFLVVFGIFLVAFHNFCDGSEGSFRTFIIFLYGSQRRNLVLLFIFFLIGSILYKPDDLISSSRCRSSSLWATSVGTMVGILFEVVVVLRTAETA